MKERSFRERSSRSRCAACQDDEFSEEKDFQDRIKKQVYSFSDFRSQNKYKPYYVLEFTSSFSEKNEVFFLKQFSKWRKDCEIFSQNMLASRHEVVLKFLCALNATELRSFVNKTESLKSKLGKLLKRYLEIETNLFQIDKHVNENLTTFYHRHFSVFLDILYFIKPSCILFPKKVVSCDDLDIVSYDNFENNIFPSDTTAARIFSIFEEYDEWHSIFDQDYSEYNEVSKKHISNSVCELHSFPVLSNTIVEEVKSDESVGNKTDVNAVIYSDIDLLNELQNCQQILSRIENTYNLVIKRLEASLYIKCIALKKIAPENDFILSDIEIDNDKDKLAFRFLDPIPDFDEITKIQAILNHLEKKYDMIENETFSWLQNTEIAPENDFILSDIEIDNDKDKLAFRFLDPIPDFDEITKIQAILNHLEKKYDIIENETFSWLQNTEIAPENDFILSDIEIDNDKDNLNDVSKENNGKESKYLMRFKAGNFYDWDLDDFEQLDTKLPTIVEEEASESELDSSESSLDGSYKYWQCDSRASTSFEDSDSFTSSEMRCQKAEQVQFTENFDFLKSSENLNVKLETDISETHDDIVSKSTNGDMNHFNFVSVLLYSL
ncbi:uncharacterized protein NPIL_225021 [Nephila pilipes]|uniref:Uncharacterized protein n=1 Tax=Nephila pilipes TaxID=299642 RepID=A0A8X6NWQ4_NEPPI|nr:uncharacterized protein NPIL_225021 [Nephila pilipes]